MMTLSLQEVLIVGSCSDQVKFSELTLGKKYVSLDILFFQITTFIKVRVAFVFGLQTLSLIDFSKIYQLNGLEPKNKGRTNFYEQFNLTKKYI